MKERPILFSGPMVRAILEGRKTQTRRVVKDRFLLCLDPGRDDDHADILRASPYGQPGDRLWVRETFFEEVYQYSIGDSGDSFGTGSCRKAHYLDQGTPPILGENAWGVKSNDDQIARGSTFFPSIRQNWWLKRPSIHMPRWASRITLELTGVRVERLQEISEEDAKAEGAPPYDPTAYFTVSQMGRDRIPDFEFRAGFARLWDSINGSRVVERKQGGLRTEGRRIGWQENPWVWALTFKAVKP